MNNEIKISDSITIKYIETIIINGETYYKYSFTNDSNKNVIFTEKIDNNVDIDKIKEYILNNEEDLIVVDTANFVKNTNTNNNHSNNESSNYLGTENTSSSYSGGDNAIEYTKNTKSNSNDFSFVFSSYESFDDAFNAIKGIDSCGLSNALSSFNTGNLSNKYSSISNSISTINNKINSLSNGEGIDSYVGGFQTLYNDIFTALLDTVAANIELSAENNELQLSQDSLAIFGSSDKFQSEIKDYCSLVLEGNIPSSFSEFYSNIENIYSKYNVISKSDAYNILNANNVENLDSVLEGMTDIEKENYVSSLQSQLDGIYNYLNATIGISKTDFDNMLKNDTDKLAELISNSSVDSAKNVNNGGESTYLNNFVFGMRDLYYSTESGQNALLNEFLDSSITQFDEYNALGYTNYIQYCIATGHTHDWLKEDLRGFSYTVSKINANSNFSSLSDEISKDELDYINSFILAFGYVPYGYVQENDTFKRREYTSVGEDMLYYMDYHMGEDSNDTQYITAFSTQGKMDAIERNYKGEWINNRVESGYSQTEALRDYNILSGTIIDEERKNELKNEGNLSFSELANFINYAQGDIENLANSEFIEKNKEKIMELTGLTENSLYDFSVSEFSLIKNLSSTIEVSTYEMLSGLCKFFENVEDAAITAMNNDFFLNLAKFDLANEDSYLFEKNDELSNEIEKLREEMWNSYFNSDKYKTELENFKNSSYSDELIKKYYDTYLFDITTGMYKGLDGKNYATYESIPLSAKEGIITTLFKNEKYSEWSINDTSSSNLYLAAFKQGIRNNGDFTYFDSLSEDIVNNATKQFETMEEVSVDKTGEWWQLNVFNTEEFINKENLSFVKHDNILGMTFNQVGNMAIPVLSSMIPGVGQVLSNSLLFTSSFGGSAEEAFNSGASYNEALTYATLSASTELFIEHVFSGIAGYGEGWLDNALEYIPNKVLESTNLTDNLSAQVIKKLVTNGLGEGIEEVTTDFVTPLWQSITYLNDQSYLDIVKENVSLESEVQTFLVSFLSSMIFGSTEIIQKTNLFNNQLSNLTEQIGNIPGMKEAANTVLAEIIGYDANVLTSDIVTKLIEKTSANLTESLDTSSVELLQNLYNAKNTLDTTKVNFEIDNNQVSVPLGFAMDTLDMTGLTSKYNIENDTIVLKNKDSINYAKTLYNIALDNLNNTQVKNAMNLEVLAKELDTKTYTKESLAIALNILLENNIDIYEQSDILLNEENISTEERVENIYKQAIELIEKEGNNTNENIKNIKYSIERNNFNAWDIVSETTNGNIEYNGIVIDTTGETIKEEIDLLSDTNERIIEINKEDISNIETKTNKETTINTTTEQTKVNKSQANTIVGAVAVDTAVNTNTNVNTETSSNQITNVENTSNKTQDTSQTNVSSIKETKANTTQANVIAGAVAVDTAVKTNTNVNTEVSTNSQTNVKSTINTSQDTTQTNVSGVNQENNVNTTAAGVAIDTETKTNANVNTEVSSNNTQVNTSNISQDTIQTNNVEKQTSETMSDAEFIEKYGYPAIKDYYQYLYDSNSILDLIEKNDLEKLEILRNIAKDSLRLEGTSIENDLDKKLITMIDYAVDGGLGTNIKNIIINGEIVADLNVAKEFITATDGKTSLEQIFDMIRTDRGDCTLLFASDSTIDNCETFLEIADNNGFSNEYTKVLKQALDIVKSNVDINEKCLLVSKMRLEVVKPTGFDVFEANVEKNGIDVAISELAKTNISLGDAANNILYLGISSDSSIITREYYYKAFDYLTSNNVSVEKAVDYVRTKLTEYYDVIGAREIYSDSSGLRVTVAFNYNDNNLDSIFFKLMESLESARKDFGNTDLQEIFISDRINPDDLYWEKVGYKEYSGNKRFISAATAGSDIINIWNGELNSSSTIIHEYGHTLDFYIERIFNLPERLSQSSEWANAIQTDKTITIDPISDYATASFDEDFAEFVKYYEKDPLGTAIRYPNRFNVLSKYIDLHLDEKALQIIQSNDINLAFDQIFPTIQDRISFIQKYTLENGPYSRVEVSLAKALDSIYPNKTDLLDSIGVSELFDIITLDLYQKGFSVYDTMTALKNLIDGNETIFDEKTTQLLSHFDKETLTKICGNNISSTNKLYQFEIKNPLPNGFSNTIEWKNAVEIDNAHLSYSDIKTIDDFIREYNQNPLGTAYQYPNSFRLLSEYLDLHIDEKALQIIQSNDINFAFDQIFPTIQDRISFIQKYTLENGSYSRVEVSIARALDNIYPNKTGLLDSIGSSELFDIISLDQNEKGMTAFDTITALKNLIDGNETIFDEKTTKILKHFDKDTLLNLYEQNKLKRLSELTISERLDIIKGDTEVTAREFINIIQDYLNDIDISGKISKENIKILDHVNKETLTEWLNEEKFDITQENPIIDENTDTSEIIDVSPTIMPKGPSGSLETVSVPLEFNGVATDRILSFMIKDTDSIRKALFDQNWNVDSDINTIAKLYNYYKSNGIKLDINPNLEEFIIKYESITQNDSNILLNIENAFYKGEDIISLPFRFENISYIKSKDAIDIIEGKKDISEMHYSEIELSHAVKEIAKYFEGKNVTLSENVKKAFNIIENLDENMTICNFIDAINGERPVILPSTIKGDWADCSIEDVISYLNGETSFIYNGVIENLKKVIDENGLYVPSDLKTKIDLISNLKDNVIINEIEYLKGINEPIIFPKYIKGTYTDPAKIYGWLLGADTIEYSSLRDVSSAIKVFSDYVVSNNIMLDESIMKKIDVISNLKANEVILNLDEFLMGKDAIITNNFQFDSTTININAVIDLIRLNNDVHLRILGQEIIDGISRDNLFRAIDELYKVMPSLKEETSENYKLIKDIFDNNYVLRKLYIIPKQFGNIDSSLIDAIISNPNKMLKYSSEQRINIMNAIDEFMEYIKDNISSDYEKNRFISSYDKLVEFISRDVPNIDIANGVYSDAYHMFKSLETFGVDQGVIREMLENNGIKKSIQMMFDNIGSDTFLKDLRDAKITKDTMSSALDKVQLFNEDISSISNLIQFISNNDVLNLIRNNYPGMSEIDAIRFMYLMETYEAGGNGICNYASAANMIFEYFRGKEELFEQNFGYPMYITLENGKKALNDKMLLADMYSIINDGVLVKNVNGSYEIDITNNNYVYLSREGRLTKDALDKFLKRKGLEINLKETFFFDSASDVMHKEEILLGIKDSLESNQYITISAGGFNLYDLDGTIAKENCGGHIMTILGINSEGKIIVDSWGSELLIDLEELIDNLGSTYGKDNLHRWFYVVSYEFTDTPTNINISPNSNINIRENALNSNAITSHSNNSYSPRIDIQEQTLTNVRSATYLKTRAIMQYNSINNTSYSFNKVYNTLVSKNIYSYISDPTFTESAKSIITASKEVGFDTTEIDEIVSILDSNISLEDKYAYISKIHIDNVSPKSYSEFTNLYSKYQNTDKVISILENMGYDDFSISDALLYKALIEQDKDISRSLYNKSFDYLISKGRTKEVAALKLQTYYEYLLNERGVHTLFTTNGIDIKIVNGFNSNNKLLNPNEISKMLEQSTKYYEGTDLKEIIIYDTFSPNNKYFENVKYKNYTGKKAFVSAASATNTSISLWSDFDDINALVHEYGHTIDRHIGKTYAYSNKFSNSEAWINAVKSDKDFNHRIISKYATASLEEDFAEFLRVFHKDPINAAMSYPNRYKTSSRYLNLELDEKLIEEYIQDSPILYVIDDAIGILSKEGSPLSFIKDYLNDTPYNSFANKIFNELNMMYENKLEIFEDFTTYQVLESIKLETNISAKDFINIIKDYLNNKKISNKISRDNIKILDLMPKNEINEWIKEKENLIETESEPLIIDESDYTSASLFKKSNDISTLEKVLKEDISLLNETDLKRLVDYINKGKIKIKNQNLSMSTVHTLLNNNVNLNKIYPISNVKVIKTFIDYFSLDTLIQFDKLNNGFLLMNNAENSYQLFDYHDLSIPKQEGMNKIDELYNLITYTINSNKTSEYRDYTFNYQSLENTEYAKKHPELFLDISTPNELKELYYTGKINSGNEYDSKYSKYLEGKSVKGIIHKRVQELDINIVKNINNFSSKSTKYLSGLEQLSKKTGLSTTIIQEVLSKKLKNLIDNSEFVIRRSGSSLLQILENGKFKNQFEVNNSTFGEYNPDMRMTFEEEIFNLPRNTKYEERPIYGMLLPKDLNSKYVLKGPGAFYSNNNGAIFVFDLEKIKESTTLTLADSLDYASKINATNLVNPTYYGMMDELINMINSKDDLYNFEFTQLYNKSSLDVGNAAYYEFQVFGNNNHTLDNIKKILFTKNPSQQVITKLKELNINWEVL